MSIFPAAFRYYTKLFQIPTKLAKISIYGGIQRFFCDSGFPKRITVHQPIPFSKSLKHLTKNFATEIASKLPNIFGEKLSENSVWEDAG